MMREITSKKGMLQHLAHEYLQIWLSDALYNTHTNHDVHSVRYDSWSCIVTAQKWLLKNIEISENVIDYDQPHQHGRSHHFSCSNILFTKHKLQYCIKTEAISNTQVQHNHIFRTSYNDRIARIYVDLVFISDRTTSRLYLQLKYVCNSSDFRVDATIAFHDFKNCDICNHWWLKYKKHSFENATLQFAL